jgi:hypothetical protein
VEQGKASITIEMPVPEPIGSTLQVIDPEVSKAKFNQETQLFLDAMDIHRRRGILVLDCAYPNVKLAFCAPQIKPAPIVFAVNINFTNYDMGPLSVRFIDAFTFELIPMAELPSHFVRKIIDANGQPQMQPLAVRLPDGTPFICIPGVREYHNHPDHSNDPWLTHRGKGGEGTLGFIIDKLYQYGIVSLNGYLLQVTFQKAPLGIDINKVPS